MRTGTGTGRKGMPNIMKLKILDWAAHYSMIVLSSSQAPQESGYTGLVAALAGEIDAFISLHV